MRSPNFTRHANVQKKFISIFSDTNKFHASYNDHLFALNEKLVVATQLRLRLFQQQGTKHRQRHLCIAAGLEIGVRPIGFLVNIDNLVNIPKASHLRNFTIFSELLFNSIFNARFKIELTSVDFPEPDTCHGHKLTQWEVDLTFFGLFSAAPVMVIFDHYLHGVFRESELLPDRYCPSMNFHWLRFLQAFQWP